MRKYTLKEKYEMYKDRLKEYNDLLKEIDELKEKADGNNKENLMKEIKELKVKIEQTDKALEAIKAKEVEAVENKKPAKDNIERVPVSVRLNKSINTKLELEAKKQGKTKSKLAEELLTERLQGGQRLRSEPPKEEKVQTSLSLDVTLVSHIKFLVDYINKNGTAKMNISSLINRTLS